MKILIIEDEKALAESIESYFTESWQICNVASTVSEAMQMLAVENYDCVLLDLMLPDGNGLRVIESLKKLKRPDGIIIISAKDSLLTRIESLNMGADDFLVKPFHISELMARVLAVVRRKNIAENSILTFNEIEIDLNLKTVKVHQNIVDFTPKEFELLLYLFENKNKVLSRSELAQHLSGDLAGMIDNYDFVYTHIKNIKKKLHELGARDYIKTNYGLGYRWLG
jgi:DNA-binding response OmpR family regulator